MINAPPSQTLSEGALQIMMADLADVPAVLCKIEIPLAPFAKGGNLCHGLITPRVTAMVCNGPLLSGGCTKSSSIHVTKIAD